jgi:hypothetical protein
MFTGQFFVRQQTNQCGLHALQNMFKSAALTKRDMHAACEAIFQQTGDPIYNHESMGGDWSVAAIVMVLVMEGYQVSGAVSSKAKRTWTGKSLDVLLDDPQFRGIILHQPKNRHFTCLRPEQVGTQRHLFFVDSQSSGPIRISKRLAKRRCLAAAYAWEPYIVMGKEMEFVAPPPDVQKTIPVRTSKRVKRRPSEDFMKIWNSTKE